MDIVLNWLWQGGVVAAAAAAILRAIPQSRTQARYCAAWAACVVVLALPVAPIIVAAASPGQAVDYPVSAARDPWISMPIAWWTSTALAIGFWTIWAGVHAGRLVVASLALHETKGRCREFPHEVEARLHHWSRMKVTGRRTRLVLSNDVRSAAVIGCGRPIIAVAPGLLERLGEGDLDRIVIHEWAHVQRRDDVSRFIQLLVRVIAGWHPAVWWLERQMALEREVACDEMAVAVTGSAKEYAGSLVKLAALPVGRAVSLAALAAVGASGLRSRIIRILAAHQVVSARPWRAIAICAGAALATLALAVGDVHLVKSGVPSLTMPRVPRPAAKRTTATDTPTDRMTRTSAASRSMASRSPSSGERLTRAEPPAASPARYAIDSRSAPAVAGKRTPYSDWLLDAPTFESLGTSIPVEVPDSRIEPHWAPPVVETASPPDAEVRAPWTAAAEAGVAIGRRYQDAGVATAGFFSRFGKKIAGSF